MIVFMLLDAVREAEAAVRKIPVTNETASKRSSALFALMSLEEDLAAIVKREEREKGKHS